MLIPQHPTSPTLLLAANVPSRVLTFAYGCTTYNPPPTLPTSPTRKGSELLQQRVAAQRVEFVPPVFADRVGEAAGFLKPQFELVSNFVCLLSKSFCGAFLRACLSSCASRRSLRV
jgi:hypothetical protein